MFITVFLDFINTFAGEYKLKLFFLVVLSIIAAVCEFLGLSLIYSFAILLSKNTLTIPLLGQISAANQSKGALLLGLLVAFTYIFKDVFMIAYINFQNTLVANITNHIFKKNYLVFMGQNYFVTRKLSDSDKQRILGTSVSLIMTDLISGTLSLFANLIVALGILSYLFIKFNTTALIVTIFIFLIWFCENLYLKSRAKKYGEMLHNSERAKSDFTLSTLCAQKDVIIYNKKDEFTKYAYKIQEEYSKCKKDMNTNKGMPTYITEIGVMGAFILFVILQLVKNPDGAILGAGLAAIAAVILRIIPAINKTQNCLYAINSSKCEAQWFIEVMKTLEATEGKINDSREKLPFNNKISVENANFYYDEKTHALKDINFEIKKGEFVGILGPSGSGKTTLFNLISALFEPQSGIIKADENIICGSNVKMWQNNISILSQEFSLPFKTIWQNVVFEPDESKFNLYKQEEIQTALTKAGIFNELNADIFKNPKELSMGQKHRVALSRAFYYDREIIMLDEATSALDVETENEISATIESIKGQKTVIAIAHRLKTLKNCDKLIYMAGGKIIDTGTLNELMQRHESFRRLVELSQF